MQQACILSPLPSFQPAEYSYLLSETYLRRASNVSFAGIVTWSHVDRDEVDVGKFGVLCKFEI